MSTPDERLAAIQAIYDDASDNEPNDLAQATTAAQVTAIQLNLANAKNAYFTAVAAALTNAGAAVETAYQAAQQALKAVQQARTNSAQIATLLQKLNGATAAATSLLKAAKSA